MDYSVKIAKVNLNNSSWEDIFLSGEEIKDYIGASGLGIKLLCNEKIVEPLEPENPLIFTTGPFTNTPVPTSGRHQIITRSPLTGIFGEADVGGSWGESLKKTGYDGLIIKGKSDKPLMVKIEENNISFISADKYWGKDTYDVAEEIKNDMGSEANISCIGPSAEKGCLISGIFHDGKHARVAARSGVGAVMGSKNLKAIVVMKGNLNPVYRDEESFKEKTSMLNKKLAKNGAGLRENGTAGGVEGAEALGDLPIKNWLNGSFEEGAEKISGPKMTETILSGVYACKRCPVACGREVKFDEGPYAPVDGGGPEYESAAMLGSLCSVDNLEAVAKANELCNRYGIDTIDAGAAVAFAMECYEHGILNEDDLKGTLNWGDPDGLIRIIKMIGEMEGIGATLGLGVARAAEKIGKGTEEFAIHVKKMAVPAHDPRCYKGMAVGYATSNRGACHLQSFTYPWERSASWSEIGYDEVVPKRNSAGKGVMTAKYQNLMGIADSLKICKFSYLTGITLKDIVELLNNVTGWEYTLDDLYKTGERIYNLKRLYNVKLGVSSKDDILPKRLLSHKRGSGGSAEALPDLEIMLKEYYQYRNWNNNGVPTQEKISELGLEEYKSFLLI